MQGTCWNTPRRGQEEDEVMDSNLVSIYRVTTGVVRPYACPFQRGDDLYVSFKVNRHKRETRAAYRLGSTIELTNDPSRQGVQKPRNGRRHPPPAVPLCQLPSRQNRSHNTDDTFATFFHYFFHAVIKSVSILSATGCFSGRARATYSLTARTNMPCAIVNAIPKNRCEGARSTSKTPGSGFDCAITPLIFVCVMSDARA